MEVYQEIAQLLKKLRDKNPLVHQITNYVTANDCANITLAIGASPVMAEDIHEVREMVSLASSLVINLGTLDSRKIEAMIEAGRMANELSIPVILDPVGVGATVHRTEAGKRIIREVRLTAIRGNLSEIKALAGLKTQTRGVDSSEVISKSEEIFEPMVSFAKEFANQLNTVVAITGVVDIIADGKTVYYVENGHEIMSKVTGTGCMCTALIGAYLGTEHKPLIAVLAGVVSMGIAGEIAFENLDKKSEGTGSLKTRILDAIYHLSDSDISERGKVYEG